MKNILLLLIGFSLFTLEKFNISNYKAQIDQYIVNSIFMGYKPQLSKTFPNTDFTKCKDKIETFTEINFADPIFHAFFQYSGKGFNQYGDFVSCKKTEPMTYLIISIYTWDHPELRVGLCLPNVCYPDSLYSLIEDYLNHIDYKNSTIKTFTLKIENILDSYKIGNSRLHGVYICASIIALFVILILISSIKEFMIKYMYIYFTFQNYSKSIIMTIINCFNIFDHTKEILKAENKIDPKLNALQFLRFIGLYLVFISHFRDNLLFFQPTMLVNYTEIYKMFNPIHFTDISYRVNVAVDIFLALGGFFSAMTCISVFEKKENRTISSFLSIYIQRYFRIFPLMFMAWMITCYFLPHYSHGLATFHIFNNQFNCLNRAFPTFLYVENLLVNFGQMCNPWIWSCFVDMQLFLLVPFIIYFTMINLKLGIKILIFLFSLSVLLQYYVIEKHNLNTNNIGYQDFNYYFYFYPQTYTRCNSYFLGIIYCFIYMESRSKKAFQNSFFHNFNQLFKTRFIRYFLTFSAIVIMCVIIYIQNWFDTSKGYPRFLMIVNLIFYRTIFISGLLLFIHPLILGFSRPLVPLLCSLIVNVIGKISFGIYLFHLQLYYYVMGNKLNSSIWNYERGFFESHSWFVLIFPFSFVMTIAFESPIIQLVKNLVQILRNSSISLSFPSIKSAAIKRKLH